MRKFRAIWMVFMAFASGILAASELEVTLNAQYEAFSRYEAAKSALFAHPAARAYEQHFAYGQLAAAAKKAAGKQRAQLEQKMSVLAEYENFWLGDFLSLPPEPEVAKIRSIYEVLGGYSSMRELEKNLAEFAAAATAASTLTSAAENYERAAKAAAAAGVLEAKYLQLPEKINAHFASDYQNLLRAKAIYDDKARTQLAAFNRQINAQYERLARYAVALAAILLLRWAVVFALRNWARLGEKLYDATKIINVFTAIVVGLFSAFYFVENISYLISVLGFASAGLAIAMKDMFMSWLGWCVLQFGGSFRVGERVRVCKDGSVYVGDIIDISLLKMTIYEDVTLTTYEENRRAGRLIYIPNNYIFTELIANYNHQALRSVWDGVDITLSFDSDIELARRLMLEAAAEHTQQLAATAKTAISKMRAQYSMRSSGTEAKIYTMIEPYGVRLSVWYMASSRETLRVRSVVSQAILARLLEAPGIKLAYPTQTIYKKEVR